MKKVIKLKARIAEKEVKQIAARLEAELEAECLLAPAKLAA